MIAYTTATFQGKKIKQMGLQKYVGRVKEFGRTLSELMQQFDQDLESLLTNLDSFVVTHRRSFYDRDVAD